MALVDGSTPVHDAGNGGAAGNATADATGGATGSDGTDAGGGASESWRSALPQELQSNPTLAKYGTLEGAAKALIGAQDLIGRKEITPQAPGDGATPEDWDAFYGKLGRPESPDAYQWEPGDSGAAVADDEVQSLREKLHGLGLREEQFAGVMELYADGVAQRTLTPPGDDATPEDRAAFYDKLGRPEAPGAYGWEPPEGDDWNREHFEAAREKLHNLGLREEQFAGVMELYAADRQTAQEAAKRAEETWQQEFIERFEAETKEAVEALRRDWGEQTETRAAGVVQLMEKFPETKQALVEAGLGNNVNVMRFLDAVAQLTAEDSATGGAAANLDAQIEDVENRLFDMDMNHPQYDTLEKRRAELYRRRFPGVPAAGAV